MRVLGCPCHEVFAPPVPRSGRHHAVPPIWATPRPAPRADAGTTRRRCVFLLTPRRVEGGRPLSSGKATVALECNPEVCSSPVRLPSWEFARCKWPWFVCGPLQHGVHAEERRVLHDCPSPPGYAESVYLVEAAFWTTVGNTARCVVRLCGQLSVGKAAKCRSGIEPYEAEGMFSSRKRLVQKTSKFCM